MRRIIRQGRSRAARVGARLRSFLAYVTGYGLLRRRSDARNIDRLRAELGCSLDDARRLYAYARLEGFGAAYEAVFGPPPRHARRRPIAAPAGRGAKVLRGLRSQRGHRAQPS